MLILVAVYLCYGGVSCYGVVLLMSFGLICIVVFGVVVCVDNVEYCDAIILSVVVALYIMSRLSCC